MELQIFRVFVLIGEVLPGIFRMKLKLDHGNFLSIKSNDGASIFLHVRIIILLVLFIHKAAAPSVHEVMKKVFILDWVCHLLTVGALLCLYVCLKIFYPAPKSWFVLIYENSVFSNVLTEVKQVFLGFHTRQIEIGIEFHISNKFTVPHVVASPIYMRNTKVHLNINHIIIWLLVCRAEFFFHYSPSLHFWDGVRYEFFSLC